MHSISTKQISGIDLRLHIIQGAVIAICYDAPTHFLELLEVVDNLAAEECATIFQRWLIDNDSSPFGFDPLHDTLDTALTEIVTVTLHRKTVDTDNDLAFFIWIEVLASGVCASDFKDSLSDEILPGAIAFHDRLDQIFRHVLIVCQKLLGILGQTVAAIAEGWVVVVVADARIEAHAFDDRRGLQALNLGVGIQFIELADTERQVSVYEQLCSFRFGISHE